MLRPRALALLLFVPRLGLGADPAPEAAPIDIAERVMEATVRLEGTGVSGTGFFVLDPRDNPQSIPLLVTAAHLLQSLKGNELKAAMRQRTSDGWTSADVVFQVSGFYVMPDLDIAVLPVQIPASTHPRAMVTWDLLADDDVMQEQGVGPGSEAFLVGFPLGLIANEEGFGLLKSGHLANFPLYPTRTRSGRRPFVLDRELTDGEYGAPVFTRSPRGEGVVIGIVAKPWTTTTRMRLLTVLPSSHIRDTLDGFLKKRKGAAPRIQRSALEHPPIPAD